MKGEFYILRELGDCSWKRLPKIKAMKDVLSNGDAEALFKEAHN